MRSRANPASHGRRGNARSSYLSNSPLSSYLSISLRLFPPPYLVISTPLSSSSPPLSLYLQRQWLHGTVAMASLPLLCGNVMAPWRRQAEWRGSKGQWQSNREEAPPSPPPPWRLDWTVAEWAMATFLPLMCVFGFWIDMLMNVWFYDVNLSMNIWSCDLLILLYELVCFFRYFNLFLVALRHWLELSWAEPVFFSFLQTIYLRSTGLGTGTFKVYCLQKEKNDPKDIDS